MRVHGHLLLILFVLIGIGCGEPRRMTAANLDELSQRMSAFHRQPTQDEFLLIVNSFARFDADQTMRQNASLMATFIIFTTERYGFMIDEAPESQALLRYRTADRATFTAWLDDSSTSPQKNDVWWMAFFCTGEERWLDRLLEVASLDATSTDNKSSVIDLAGSTARWSYKANVAQWSEVLRHAERHADKGNTFARDCVAYAREHPELSRSSARPAP